MSLTPLFRRLAAYPGWLAFGAGGLTVLSFAPFSFSLLVFPCLALLFWLWRDATPRQAFRLGWLFGLGLMGVGVSWLHISIDQFGNVGLIFALLITLLFVVIVALYYGLAGWLCARFGAGSGWPRLVFCFPAVWVLAEWLKGWLFTGFPWLSLGYSQLGMPLQGYVPVLGVYGASWAVALSAGLLVLLVMSPQPGRWRAAAPSLVGLLLLWIGGMLLDQVEWTRPAGEPLKVSLIQGNIPQERKWLPEQFRPTLELYTSLTRAHWDSDLVVWPETAVPAYYHQVEEGLLKPLDEEAKSMGSELLLGIAVREEDGQYYNAMASLGGHKLDTYFKRHLVPFGEFMPLRPLLFPLIDFLKIPMSDFSAGEPDKSLLQLAGYPAGISICYEDAFGEEVIQALPQAAFLVNASNDAWFGDSLAPHQHLEIARMRALESGRYLLRATNTGVSAIIGPRGDIRGISPAFELDVLTREILPMSGVPPYARLGNRGIVLLSLVLFVVGAGVRLRRDRQAG